MGLLRQGVNASAAGNGRATLDVTGESADKAAHAGHARHDRYGYLRHYCNELATELARGRFFALLCDRETPPPAARGPVTLTLYNTLTRRKEPFQPIDAEQRAHVCVRTDGLRLRPHRQRAARHRVRRAVPAAAAHLWRRARHLRPQHHRRRRQDQRAGGGGRRLHRRADRAHHQAVPRRHRGAGRAAADRRAARHRPHRRDDRC